ncbi:MAG: hypothetical protein KDJ38_05540 [Gammaproteobacteria bacterium]|nr:hypothetical protein [Gammaproteobacteria bacterium]
MLKFFFYLHLLGLLVLLAGVAWYVIPQEPPDSMVGIASAIGLGLMMISPYPVVRVVKWMMAQDAGK